jgi:hypothetical protein
MIDQQKQNKLIDINLSQGRMMQELLAGKTRLV